MVKTERACPILEILSRFCLKAVISWAIERIRGVTILLLRASSQKTKKKASQILRSYGTDPHDMPFVLSTQNEDIIACLCLPYFLP